MLDIRIRQVSNGYIVTEMARADFVAQNVATDIAGLGALVEELADKENDNGKVD